MSNKPSELFEEVFSAHHGSCVMDCDCGRTHFDSYNSYDWQEGELEGLQKKAKENPSKYIEHDGTVSSMMIAGHEIVYDCECDLAKKYEQFILSHAEQLSEYLRKHAEELRKKADKIDVPIK